MPRFDSHCLLFVIYEMKQGANIKSNYMTAFPLARKGYTLKQLGTLFGGGTAMLIWLSR